MDYWTPLRRAGRYASSDVPGRNRQDMLYADPFGTHEPGLILCVRELPARFTRDSDTDLSLAVSLYPPDLFRCRSPACCLFRSKIRRFWSGAREELLRHLPLPPCPLFQVKRMTSGAFCTSELGQPGHNDKDRVAATAQCDAKCNQ